MPTRRHLHPKRRRSDNDRQRHLREALGCLSPRDRRLISLVYFEGRSVREAGRHLGWRKSAADRRHRDALERLRSVVGDDRSLLSPASLGLAAWVAVAAERGSGLTGRLGEGLRRLVPFAEPGGAALSGGAGRVAGACGAGLVAAACGLLATGVHPELPGIGGSEPSQRLHARRAAPRSAPEPVAVAPAPALAAGEGGGGPGRDGGAGKRRVEAPPAEGPRRRAGRPLSRPSPEPVEEGFGVQGGAPEEPPAEERAGVPASSGTGESPSGAGSRPREATGGQVSEAFGL